MSYTVAGSLLVALLGLAALLVIKKLLADEKSRQAKLRVPRRLWLSAADLAAQEAAEAKRQRSRNPKFGRKAFEKPKPSRNIFGW